jgi:hypothetical protein
VSQFALQNYTTDLKTDYPAKNAQLDVTLAHMTDVFPAYLDSFSKIIDAPINVLKDKLKLKEFAETVSPANAKSATKLKQNA